MKRQSWILFSGWIWLGVGMTLLYKGVHFIAQALLDPSPFLEKWFGSKEQGSTFLIVLSLFIGFLKGRFVLAKTVDRMVKRILHLPLPIRLQDVYPLSYVALLLGMIFLGILLRFFPLSVRGVIDVAIGSALVQGGILYFRAAKAVENAFK